MPLMIQVWHMVTEKCVLRKILKCCVWRVISKHCFWCKPEASQKTVSGGRFWNVAFDAWFWNVAFDEWFQNIASDAPQMPTRCNISKHCVRRKISKSCFRFYFLWPRVRHAVRVWLCRTAWFVGRMALPNYCSQLHYNSSSNSYIHSVPSIIVFLILKLETEI